MLHSDYTSNLRGGGVMKEFAPKAFSEQDAGIDVADWDQAKKSTRCEVNGSCVEVASGEGGAVGFQDSKQEHLPDDERPRLVFPIGAAATFLAAIKSGE